MRPFSILHTVTDRERRDTTRVRVVGMLGDGAIAVAVMTAGAGQAESEVEFSIDEAVAVADACLGGDRRALTRPGLARMLCGAVLALAKAAQAGGLLEERLPDETPAPADEGADEPGLFDGGGDA